MYQIFHRNGGRDAAKEIGVKTDWRDVPTAPKFLRLSFHDCLRYVDGTGGCDGCLNWKGVGSRTWDSTNSWKYPNVGNTSNNGLGPTVQVLEELYNNRKFPKGSPALDQPLRASGKSRADLWALAGILSVEFGIETNNQVCDGTYENNPDYQCNAELGKDTCQVQVSRPITFKTGRKDCVGTDEQNPYQAVKEEVQPSAVGNGQMTLDFFNQEFGFNGRETVAIMGSHTFGRNHVQISLFRYVWTTRGTESFNNHYYKNIVREDMYAFMDNACTKVPDARGNLPKVRWVPHVRKDTTNGGPVQWIKENYRCPLCKEGYIEYSDQCCQNIPDGYFCQPDDADESETDANAVNGGCERYRLVSGIDETAMSSEIGLYFDFKVTEDGIPYGCPGMETFKSDNFNKSYSFTWSTTPKRSNPDPTNPRHWLKADPNCPPNTSELPKGSTPLHLIFEEYAKDQNKWITDFISAYEKMISNGYEDEDLIEAPTYDDVVCPRKARNDKSKKYKCSW